MAPGAIAKSKPAPDPMRGDHPCLDGEHHTNGYNAYTHGIYIGRVAKLEVRDSYFHDTTTGHLLKSRAAQTVIERSRFEDGADGTAGRQIDLPNGGQAVIRNSVLYKGPKASQGDMVSFGVEGSLHAVNELRVEATRFTSERTSGPTTGVRNTDGTMVTFASDNTYKGVTTLATGPYQVESATPPPLFTAAADVVDFDAVAPGTVDPATTMDALGGDDRVTLGSVFNEVYRAEVFRAGDGNDAVTGRGLNDQIDGGVGNDTLNGGPGADVMAGGTGNDTYVVDNTADIVTEAASAGIDTVRSSVSISALAANVEDLVLLGSANLNGTGNALSNALTGNGGINTLSGGDGNDTLRGGLGRDTLTGGVGNDIFRFDGTGDFGDRITDFNNGKSSSFVDRLTFDVGTDQIRIGNDNTVVDSVVLGRLSALNQAGAEVLVRTDGSFTQTEIQGFFDTGLSKISAGVLLVGRMTETGAAAVWYDPNPQEPGGALRVADLTNLTSLKQLSSFDASDFMFVWRRVRRG